MNNEQTKDLCLSLMKADTEDEVIELLKDASLWDDSSVWRNYGDNESNFSTIGNQSSRPDAALVEKLVNSADHRLINECLSGGIDPESLEAPQSVREAVARFFDQEVAPEGITAGRIGEWDKNKRKSVAEGITLAATGSTPSQRGNPCFTISDSGEGQTPKMMPHTFLSLPSRGSNKIKIPFVQGKFNMGGTGVLQFCGKRNLQLILSRRNPEILSDSLEHESDRQWGFTVVRREVPTGSSRSSVYTYLAPLDTEAKPGEGSVLRFSAEDMPIFPQGSDAYVRRAAWGTLVKLYEYSAKGYSNTHILRKDGLLHRLDLLLPDAALPIRLHECRSGFRGHRGSFETTLTGLSVRLEDNRGENMEEDFPTSSPISAAGQQMTATIYGFKKGKADTYRRNEGVLFTLNGQTHSHLSKGFFSRKAVGRMNRIADSILVTVDCSSFDVLAREDFFMNSRDRQRGGELSVQIEGELEVLLKNHPGLRALKDRRQQEEIASKVEDSKPLEDVLKTLVKQSPVLASLFLQGPRLSNPFAPTEVKTKQKVYKGERYPTYFKFKGKKPGAELNRECPENQRFRITFETDAVNNYFDRKIDQGEFSLFLDNGDSRFRVENSVGPHLNNGSATLSVRLPDNCREGDTLRYVSTVTDPSRVDSFENSFTVKVLKAVKPQSGGPTPPSPLPPSQEKGEDRQVPSGIAFPPIHDIHESDWGNQDPPFDKYAAMRVITDENPKGQDIHEFYVNMDNIYLKTELKSASQEPELTKARWRFGLVLLGLAVLNQHAQTSKVESKNGSSRATDGREDNDSVETKIEDLGKAVGPFLLPIIHSLGTLDVENTLAVDDSGEEM